MNSLRNNPPQLASISNVTIIDITPCADSNFTILSAIRTTDASAIPLPTARTADRAATTMAAFTMCTECADEYSDHADRRFHAQPNACATCGPSLELVPHATPLADCTFTNRDSLATIHAARALLRSGSILAVKGLGGFLLACDAGNTASVAELRRRKHRPHKPFALMVRDLDSLRTICLVSSADEAILLNPRRPIVVLPRLAQSASPAKSLPAPALSASCSPTHHSITSSSATRPTSHPTSLPL